MSNNLTQRPQYMALQAHHTTMYDKHMRDLFADDPKRFDKFHLKLNGLLLDYSKHRITNDTMKLLVGLAKASDVEGWRKKMFAGEVINNTENRAVLHTALRGSVDKKVTVDGENVSEFVDKTLQQIKAFSDKVRKEKKYTDIINLGIGGSDLGTRTVYKALGAFADGPRVHFVPNIDGTKLRLLLDSLNPEKTLVIVVSKTFSTLETRLNAEAVRAWAGKSAKDNFVAVTENTKEAEKFGIPADRIFPLRKWVGGRYSIWGAVGLPITVAIGFENFQKFLSGAKDMDTHFATAPLEKNAPVLMALLGIWYRNFFNFASHAVIPYSQGLQSFHAYLQQLDMESNGKSVNRDGEKLDYATGPAIFGDPGTNAQHAFFQSFHQGTDIVPVDFILNAQAEKGYETHHIQLNANALAQAKGFMEGAPNNDGHRDYPGNRPSSTIVLDTLDPYHLGMLMALYEHKVFVQGVIWNINSFDQWGVELGKVLSKDIVQALESKAQTGHFESSTEGLLQHLKSRPAQ